MEKFDMEIRTRRDVTEVVAFEFKHIKALVDLAGKLKFPGWKDPSERG